MIEDIVDFLIHPFSWIDVVALGWIVVFWVWVLWGGRPIKGGGGD